MTFDFTTRDDLRATCYSYETSSVELSLTTKKMGIFTLVTDKSESVTEEVLKSTLFFSFYTYISFNTIGKRNECLTWSANI